MVFQGGSDLADLRPGDVVKIMDPEKVGVRLGGRVLSGGTDQVALDAPVTLGTGENYTLSVRLPDGTVEDRAVTTAAGDVSVLDLATPLSAAPMDGAVWLLYSDSIEPEQARILTVTEPEEGVYQFECLAYNASLFDEIDQTGSFTARTESLIPTGPLPVPGDFDVRESLVQSGPTVGAIAELDWRNPSDIRVRRAEVQVKRPDDSFKPVPVVDVPPVILRDVTRGAYQFRVRFIDGLGRRGGWATVSKTLFGLTADPEQLTGLKIQRLGGLAILTWDMTPDLDVRVGGFIHIRHSATGAGLSTSVRAVQPLPGASVSAVVPLRPGTYYVFARDSGGRAGPAATIETDDAEALTFSALGFVEANPTWPGTHDDTVRVGDDLRLVTTGLFSEIVNFADEPSIASLGAPVASGTYTMSVPIDLGLVKDVRITADIEAISLNLDDSFATRPGLFSEWASFTGTPATETEVVAQISTTQDDPSGSPVWSAYTDLTAGDYRARAVLGRLLLQTQDQAQTISVGKFRIDAKEIA